MGTTIDAAARPETEPAAADQTPVTSVPDVSRLWQERADRLGRRLLLPLLAVPTALAALTLPGGHQASSRLEHGLIVVAVAAVWSAALFRYPVTGVPARTRVMVFAIQLLLAGVLVWVNPWYGVFAFTGYLFADELGPRWRTAGFAATAVVLAASQTGSYPNGWTSHTVVYMIMVGFNLVAVLSMVRLTNRVIEQNTERGRIIDELADANSRLEASMAENAGLHAQLVVQAREAGIAEERHRLAGEIHDTIAQGLTGIVTQLEAARRAREARHDPAEWSRHLDLADSLARANLTEARRSVRALRPEQLEDATLPEALDDLARSWAERAKIPADLDTTGTPRRADPDVEATLFRVAQEALTNVAKHAHAARVHLTLSYLDDALLLDVADDGIGFQPTAAGTRANGYGLVGMRHRLDRLAGTLTVESARGYGTTINAAVPLRPSPAGR